MTGPVRDKTLSLALLLPLAGLFLLMPPMVLVFSMPSDIAGLPVIIVYIFAVWGFLIIGAAWLARRLAPPSELAPPLNAPPARETSPTSGDPRD